MENATEQLSAGLVQALAYAVVVLSAALTAVGGLLLREKNARLKDALKNESSRLRGENDQLHAALKIVQTELDQEKSGRLDDAKEHSHQYAEIGREVTSTVGRFTASFDTLVNYISPHRVKRVEEEGEVE